MPVNNLVSLFCQHKWFGCFCCSYLLKVNLRSTGQDSLLLQQWPARSGRTIRELFMITCFSSNCCSGNQRNDSSFRVSLIKEQPAVLLVDIISLQNAGHPSPLSFPWFPALAAPRFHSSIHHVKVSFLKQLGFIRDVSLIQTVSTVPFMCLLPGVVCPLVNDSLQEPTAAPTVST